MHSSIELGSSSVTWPFWLLWCWPLNGRGSAGGVSRSSQGRLTPIHNIIKYLIFGLRQKKSNAQVNWLLLIF